MQRSLLLLFFAVLVPLATGLLATNASPQRRDYMTDAEIELVRDAQDIDARIGVLSKMIDRRFAALGINVGGAAIPNKETDKWGPTPVWIQNGTSRRYSKASR